MDTVSDRDGPRSNPYHPDPVHCCEACVFGSGEHAAWCETQISGLTCTEFCCDAPATDAETGWCEEHLALAVSLGAVDYFKRRMPHWRYQGVTHAS